MKLEEIAKSVIKELEAKADEISGNSDLAENLDEKPNLASNSDFSEQKEQNHKKTIPNLAFSFSFESSNFKEFKNEKKSNQLVENITNDNELNAEISDFANEKYDFADKMENSQIANLQDKNLKTENLNDFADEDFSQNLQLENNLKNSQNSNDEFLSSISKINELLANLSEVKNDEVQFLSALKERILVLFEGLNAFEGDLEARVELSIKFMEFLLASIDNRVENLSK